jgi:hypothetical protein
MPNPFSRTGTPGFNVRPQDDLPGFRVNPEEEVPGFNIDENGLPRPGSFVDSQSSVQPAPPQVTGKGGGESCRENSERRNESMGGAASLSAVHLPWRSFEIRSP